MRAVIDHTQRTSSHVVQLPSRDTGWAPPRYEGTARRDNLAARMRDSIVVFPESVHIVYPKSLPKPLTGVHPESTGPESPHE